MKQVRIFNEDDRFLNLGVFQFPLGDCGGVTDSLKSIWIPCETGYMSYKDIDDKSTIFITEHRGGEYHSVFPMIQSEGIGPMAGGNLAYSSDSRCKRVYHIHDRFESQSTYDALSR
jgi:hypothetical protein